MHKESHRISKVKPKIRIIHIFAPEIIKTDVANFRELVQRLTGKPGLSDHPHRKRGSIKKQSRTSPQSSVPSPSPSSSSISEEDHELKKVEGMKNDVVLVKEEDQEGEENDGGGGGGDEMMIWDGARSGSGFLGGFGGDLDGMIQELGEFPLLQPTHQHHHALHHAFFEESHHHQLA